MDKLLSLLFKSDIDFNEILEANNITVQLYSLNTEVYGFVVYGRHDNYYIIINSRLDTYTQLKTFIHELIHITKDMPYTSHYFGLNMEGKYLESRVDELAEQIINSHMRR